MTDDHGVIRHLNRRRWQFTHGDFTFGYQHLARDRQLVTGQADREIGRHLKVGIGLNSDGQALPLQLQINSQRRPPTDLPTQAALAGFATFPGAIELHLLTRNHCLHVQVFEANRQFCASNFSTDQVQATVDLRRQ
ncbi:hypothetical protein D3C72_1560300 [compost metagenome]